MYIGRALCCAFPKSGGPAGCECEGSAGRGGGSADSRREPKPKFVPVTITTIAVKMNAFIDVSFVNMSRAEFLMVTYPALHAHHFRKLVENIANVPDR